MQSNNVYKYQGEKECRGGETTHRGSFNTILHLVAALRKFEVL